MVWSQKENAHRPHGFLLMKPIAFLVEEYDSTGTLVWSGLMTSEPTEMSWFKDLKSKLHNVTITPLIPDTKNICPQEVPTCVGYSLSDRTYGYCS